MVSFLRLFSIFPQCKVTASSTIQRSSPCFSRRRHPPPLPTVIERNQRILLFPSKSLQIPTTKHPKTFGFPSHTDSPTIQRSSPRFSRRRRPPPLPTTVELNQKFLLFLSKSLQIPSMKHPKTFGFQMAGANDLPMFCKILTMGPLCLCPAIYHFCPLVPRHKKMPHHSCNLVIVHVGLAKKTFFFTKILL